MHDQPSWVNKLLFLPAIKNKRMESPMIDPLATLIKCVTKLRQASLEVCHRVEEFYLRWIHPLDRRKILAFECPRMADPCRDPSEGYLFILSPHR
jgi:hypothetical protein